MALQGRWVLVLGLGHHDALRRRVDGRAHRLPQDPARPHRTARRRSARACAGRPVPRLGREVAADDLFATASGQFTYINPYWYDYTGRTNTGVPVDDWIEAVHPADRATVMDTWQRALATGQGCELELRFLRASDHTWRWFKAQAAPLFDDDGVIESWLVIAFDIDLVVAARNDLSRSQRRLESAVAERTAERDRLWRLSNDLMFVMNFDGAVQSVNPAWTRQLGWASDELVGRDMLRLAHPDDIGVAASVLARLRKGFPAPRFVCRCRHKDGTYRTLAWTALPGEGVIHGLGLDLTAETQALAELEVAQDALRQAQKMEAVGQLTGGIAHDFNNLLAGILGALEIIQRQSARGVNDIDRYVRMAMASANRAAALTHRLLAFSRRQPLAPKSLDASALVQGLSELLLRTLGENVRLDLATSSDLWRTRCDPHQLENAILNLAINARDAMPEGGTVTIITENLDLHANDYSWYPAVPAGRYVSLTVSDTGVGMTAEVASKAFEPFFTTKPFGQGTGLGLSMIYGFTRQSNGYIKIFSEPGKGTSVRLYLPQCDADDDEPSADAPVTVEPRAAAPAIVLVVEDNPEVRVLVVDVLTDMGFKVLRADDGTAGLALIEATPKLDLVVTDIGLPGLNGRQMIDAARTRRPDLKALLMTGYAESAVAAKQELGPNTELITKPFAMHALSKKVVAMLAATGTTEETS
ncbi:PAS domain-containing protein [Pigmentiphaga litoralis]|uniref:hybrid sensor histidine kinase/response regulator n=1 Tax=Pigmentiphaga litoralis TaxID=516702 RepID=UPI003B438E5C